MATHSSILAWEILWTKKPGGLSPWDRKSPAPLSDQHFHLISFITSNCLDKINHFFGGPYSPYKMISSLKTNYFCKDVKDDSIKRICAWGHLFQ